MRCKEWVSTDYTKGRREKFSVMRKACEDDLKQRSIIILKNRKKLVRLEHRTSYR